MTWNHDALARDLAAHLRAGGERLVWLNFAPMGMGGARPDVYAMRRWSLDRPQVVSYEIKVSVADLRSDITSGKWQKYLAFSNGVTFAAPHGMAKPVDIPAHCGLILRGERGWRHVRKPVLGQLALDTSTWLRLVNTPPNREIHGRAIGDEFDSKNWHVAEARGRAERRAMEEIGKRYGRHVAEYLREPDAAQKIMDRAKEKARGIVDEAQHHAADAAEAWQRIAAAIGSEHTSLYTIQGDLWRFIKRLSDHEEIAALRESLNDVQKALDKGLLLARLPPPPTGPDAGVRGAEIQVPAAAPAADRQLEEALQGHVAAGGDDGRRVGVDEAPAIPAGEGDGAALPHQVGQASDLGGAGSAHPAIVAPAPARRKG